ncbi:hypothetical protein CEXT_501 [Caerostris extrusa]|uniref:Uncharacterized protein n=1 Tax=Caerostris extrusa TaxID=172846 RepID=A0AAV4V2E3_CAEEX|nr:hypothetical protein CEXT_501 [Caerostris extrusa]
MLTFFKPSISTSSVEEDVAISVQTESEVEVKEKPDRSHKSENKSERIFTKLKSGEKKKNKSSRVIFIIINRIILVEQFIKLSRQVLKQKKGNREIFLKDS